MLTSFAMHGLHRCNIFMASHTLPLSKTAVTTFLEKLFEVASYGIRKTGSIVDGALRGVDKVVFE